jgi:hypothetical protein
MGEHRRRIGFQDRAIQQPALAELSDAVANHLWPKLSGVALRREGLDARARTRRVARDHRREA